MIILELFTKWTYPCRCIHKLLYNFIILIIWSISLFKKSIQHFILTWIFINLFSVILTPLLMFLWCFCFNRDLATARSHTFSTECRYLRILVDINQSIQTLTCPPLLAFGFQTIESTEKFNHWDDVYTYSGRTYKPYFSSQQLYATWNYLYTYNKKKSPLKYRFVLGSCDLWTSFMFYTAV